MNSEEFKRIQMDGRFGKDILPEKANMVCISVGSVGNLAMVMNSLYFCGDNCKDVYIDFTKKELMNWENQNPYDDVFDQNITDEYERINCWGNKLMDYNEEVLADIRNKVQPYFKFKKSLTDIIDSFVNWNNIGEDTLGVHIRMSDMNAWHGDQFGYVYYETYLKYIDELLSSGKIKNIFIASDNKETLQKLKNRYNIIYYEDVARTDNEHEIGKEPQLRKKGHERMEGFYNFYTPFIDLLLLSKCGYFIGRKHSNFSIAATMLGNMKFNNIVNLS